ncbi:MAG: peptidase M4, partial [Kiritimatiellaeota bacterium]|nr:peptidase M4 [Kiritimatiellota bacterium]
MKMSKAATMPGTDVRRSRKLPPPVTRPLKVYAFDPSRGHYLGNELTLQIPYEPLTRGPAGRHIAVVDYDGSNCCFYDPVDLDDPGILLRGGLDPAESDPQFHQQMVYAVAMETVQQFEIALGRRIHWRRSDRATQAHSDDIWSLKLYPHAMQARNAFYSPAAHGILFGYFRADAKDPGRNLPGQTIFTCLSHDVIIHETTHAVIDGIRSYFTEPTNLDVAAFHEAFADLVALFRHFARKSPLLIHAIQNTGGRLFDTLFHPPAGQVSGTDAPVLQAQ